MKRDVYKTYDAFVGDELSPQEFERLKKRTKLLNASLVTQEEIEDLKNGLVNAIRRPVNLNALQTTTQQHKSDSINANLLFTQIETQRGKKGFVTHNFSRNSQYYTRLFTWSVFNEITEAIMQPINYLLQQHRGRKHGATVINTNTAATTENQRRHILQHQIACATISCIGLINSIEEIMGCMLLKLIVNKGRLVFLFDWHEEPLFTFIIAFDASDCGLAANTSLHRSDLFVIHEVEVSESEEEDDGDGINIANDTAMTTMMAPETKKQTKKKSPVEKHNTFISFYGEKIETTVIEVLKNSLMTYITYGYIKKED